MHAVAVARTVGTNLTIDMGDAFLIPQCRQKLMELLEKKVTIIFANEDEADAFCECHHQDADPNVQPHSLSQSISFSPISPSDLSSSTPANPTPTLPAPSTSIPKPMPAPFIPTAPVTPSPHGPLMPSSSTGPLLPIYPPSVSGSRTVISAAPSALPYLPDRDLTMNDIFYGKGSAPNPPPFPEQWLKFLKYTEMLVVKRGENGSLAITNRGIAYYCPAYKVEGVLDTNGAGDNFQAGFFYGLFRGLSIPVSLKIGSFIASRVIRRRGAQPHVKISGVEYLI